MNMEQHQCGWNHYHPPESSDVQSERVDHQHFHDVSYGDVDCYGQENFSTISVKHNVHATQGEFRHVDEKRLNREERRRRRRASLKYRVAHATRERLRVEAFNSAFLTLRQLLPTLPPDKKLSKIEILRLAVCYITYLHNVLLPESSAT